jgi:hypothetical protein
VGGAAGAQAGSGVGFGRPHASGPWPPFPCGGRDLALPFPGDIAFCTGYNPRTVIAFPPPVPPPGGVTAATMGTTGEGKTGSAPHTCSIRSHIPPLDSIAITFPVKGARLPSSPVVADRNHGRGVISTGHRRGNRSAPFCTPPASLRWSWVYPPAWTRHVGACSADLESRGRRAYRRPPTPQTGPRRPDHRGARRLFGPPDLPPAAKMRRSFRSGNNPRSVTAVRPSGRCPQDI